MKFATAKREAYAKLVADARAILDKAGAEKRSLSGEEEAQYARIEADIDRVRGEIETEEKASKRADDLRACELELARPASMPEGIRSQPQGTQQAATQASERRTEFRSFMGSRERSADYAFRPEPVLAGQEWRAVSRLYSGFARELGEARALQADSMVAGGSTFALEEFLARLIIFTNNFVFVRQRATVLPVTASDSLGVPTLDTDVDDPDWTSELATGNEDSSMAFGKRALRTHPLAKRIKISNKLLQLSALDVENLVAQRLAYKYGVAQEKAYLTGTGAEQPLGVFVASADGIPAARDVTSSVTADFKADDFISMKYNLKQQYQQRPDTAWMLHRDSMAKVRKLKDGQGQYLWATAPNFGSGLVVGSPDRILDLPVMMSEYAPNTFSASQYIAILGAWSYYWIAESLNVSLRRLVELYAETNQVGFIMRGELDGAPVLAEAWTRLKLSA